MSKKGVDRSRKFSVYNSDQKDHHCVNPCFQVSSLLCPLVVRGRRDAYVKTAENWKRRHQGIPLTRCPRGGCEVSGEPSPWPALQSQTENPACSTITYFKLQVCMQQWYLALKKFITDVWNWRLLTRCKHYLILHLTLAQLGRGRL